MSSFRTSGPLIAQAVMAAAASAAFVSLAVSLATMATLDSWGPADLVLYFVALYFWCFFTSTALGLPAFFIFRRFGWDNFLSAALFGGLIGLAFAYWIGGKQFSSAAALYATVGVLGGVVFLWVLKRIQNT